MTKTPKPSNLSTRLREWRDLLINNQKPPPQVSTVQSDPTDDGIEGWGHLSPDWLIGLRTVQDPVTGARRVVELTLLAHDEENGPELNTTDLRSISLSRWTTEARAHATDVHELVAGEGESYLPALRERWGTSARGRTMARPELDYAILAAVYARRVEQGDRRPVAYIAEVVGQSTVTVTQRVREARAMGLLTPVAPGKAGGRLTPQAEALLTTLVTDGLNSVQED